MARPSSTIGGDVLSRAAGIRAFLDKVERLHASGHLSKRDVERAYAGSYLEFHAYVERSIEALFLGLLVGRLQSSDRTVRPLVKVKSDRTARNIVQGARRHVDWLPYGNYTLPLARAFFASGKPFSKIRGSSIEAFDHSGLIRNALAHQSATGLRSFRNALVIDRNLPRSEFRPASYLRGSHTIGQTRIDYMLARLSGVMRELSS